jgi:hypothetical protein
MDNDISPEGYSSPLLPFEPRKQSEAKSHEREETLAQVPLLKTVIKRFEKRLAETDSVKEALKLADKYKLTREEALILQNIVHQQLETERRYIEARINRTKP